MQEGKVKVLVAQEFPTLCDPTDCSPPGSSVLGILQARILYIWVAIPFSMPSLAAKKYNQSDFGVDHLVMPMCRVFSCVVGEGVCYDQCIFLAKLY